MSSPLARSRRKSRVPGGSPRGGGADDNDLSFSLNPELDKKDNDTAAQAMKHPLIGPVLSQVWFCALYSGDPLRNQELNRDAFQLFLERSDWAHLLVEVAKPKPKEPEGEAAVESHLTGGDDELAASVGDASSSSKPGQSPQDVSLSGSARHPMPSASGSFDAAEDQLTTIETLKGGSNKRRRSPIATEKKDEKSAQEKEDELAAEQARKEERALCEGLDAFDTQRRMRDSLNYSGFLRACIRLAFSWCDAKRRSVNEPPLNDMRLSILERLEEMVRFAQEFGVTFVKATRKAHDYKGLGSDDVYLNSRESDRLLYIYDDVFERLFHRYRARDQHQSRELTMEQNQVLDNYVELDEVREFLKDFGFFPKYISFVEISTCSQCACFGRLMVSPTKQLQGRKSDIEQNKAVAAFRAQEALQEVDEVDDEERDGVVNPLYLPSLPPEYLKDEPLLDKPRFMSCIVRLAQTLFNRPEYYTELPTIPARLEEMFRVMAGPYERIFGHPMSDDCDYTIPGIPVLSCGNGSATAVSPQELRIDGGEPVTITGSGFGEKRGVFVKFFPPLGDPIILRASEVQRRRVVCSVPAIPPGEITMITEETKEEVTIGVKYSARVYVECSNDRLSYSQTDPPQCFFTVRRTKPRQLATDVHEKLHATFSSLCQIGTDVTNTRFMIRDNWRRLKALYSVHEKAIMDDDEHESDASYNRRRAQQVDRDIYFYSYASRHEGMGELSMDFCGYLSTLCRCLYEEFRGRPGWFDKLAELADISFVPDTKPIVNLESVDMVEKELRYAQQLLISAEYRNLHEVDLFLGPVLCGSVTGRAGVVCSTVSGAKVIHEQHHPMLSYIHHDDHHTERMLLQMAHVAQSYHQFLQRAVLAGFDVAARHSNPRTRKPFGRCWQLLDSTTRKRLGVAWDYPGWFSAPAKLPAPHCLYNPKATLTFYAGAEAMLTIIGNGTVMAPKDIPGGHESIQMLYGVLAHKRCDSISHMRSMLQPHGIVFVSKLYALPK